ncbi:hypothetical protein BH10ACT2_BH10ACT2_28930 [soil metagenome]
MILALDTGIGSTLYRVLLLLHILLAIVGFGGVMLNGVYGGLAKQRRGTEGRAISEANFRVSSMAEYAIVGVPVTGVLLVWASGKAWAFSDLWIWLSLVIVVVALLVARMVLAPSHRRINTLLAEAEQHAAPGPPPQVAEIAHLGKRLAAAGGVLHLATVAVLVLMIWKPTG